MQMNKIFRLSEKLLEISIVLITVIMIISMSMQVIGREIIGRGFSWTEELAVFSMFAIVFLGLILEVRHNTNISVTVLDNLLEKKPKAFFFLKLFQNIGILLFGAYITFYGLKAAYFVADQKSFNMLISMGIMYGFVPFAGMFIVLLSLASIIKLCKQGPQHIEREAESE